MKLRIYRKKKDVWPFQWRIITKERTYATPRFWLFVRHLVWHAIITFEREVICPMWERTHSSRIVRAWSWLRYKKHWL